jgi:16S rRNA (cytidine1402-2'-O)-methyltransferase
VLVIHARAASVNAAGDTQRILQLLLAELPLKTAVKLAADITGDARNDVYAMALALKKQSDAPMQD